MFLEFEFYYYILIGQFYFKIFSCYVSWSLIWLLYD